MTINYTTLLGLAKPVTGTESGTWGDVVNDQITSLVEDAIANAASLNVASGNVTLTDNNGSSDQARMAILLVTGTPGVSRNIVAPSTSKWYIVKNGSNAEVVLKGSATTGVTIPAGVEALAFWNGSDFELVSMVGPSSSTDNAITRYDGTTGKVVQNSGVTIDDSNNMTGVVALTTTGVVTVPAGTNSAPAITTTGDTNTGIFFPAADTIAFTEGGTESVRIDSSGNVGIGTSSPGAKLQVVGIAASTGSGTSIFAAGEVGTYTLTGITSPNYGIAYGILTGQTNPALTVSGFDAIAFGTNQAERMRLDSSGNLGIGTSSPTQRLDVSDNLRVRGTRISQDNSGGNAFEIGPGSGTGDSTIWGFYAPASRGIAFLTNTNERVRITSGGDVGIGTASPSTYGDLAVYRAKTGVAAISVTQQNAATNDGAKLSTYYQTTETASLKYYWDGSQFQGQLYSYGPLAFLNGSSPTERMRLDASGRLGINVTSVEERLHVASANPTNGVIQFIQNTSTSAQTGALLKLDVGNVGTSALGIPGGTANALAFYVGGVTSGSERARITSGGQLLVGTQTSSSSLSRFNWATNARTVEIENTNASLSTDAQLFVYTERNTTNNSYYYFGCYNGTAGAWKLRIADSGDVTNTNGTYGTISDQKMKTDIVDAGSQWADIKALRFRKFKMKDDPSGLVQLGVVAQEVELTSPGLVDEHQDRDAEGNDLGTTTKSVKTSVLLMKAAVALQEAMARIEQLEAKVSALESKGA
jgi:hypothetical protein